MAINFPNSPSNLQEYTENGKTWTWYETPGYWAVKPNVQLGIDTYGGFLANIISGTGVSLIGNDGSEGAVPTVALATSGVSADFYGNSIVIPTFQVDQYGRIVSATNVMVDLNYANVTNRPVANIILTGNITGQANSVLAPSGTTFLISANVGLNSVTLGAHTIGAYVANIISGNGIAVINNTGGESNVANITLAPTGVTSASYGTTTSVGTFSVDAWGRLTSASNLAINFNYANVTNRPVANVILTGNIVGQANAVLTSGATLYIISANVADNSVTLGTHTIGSYVSNVISGNGIVVTGNDGSEGAIPNVTLSPTGVTSSTYGNATIVPVLTVDAWGRVTSVSNVVITSPAGSADWGSITNKPDPQITVTLTGNISGTGSAILEDVTSNTITISASVANNSVTLGTHTVGSYVSNVISGNGIVVTGNDGSEGAISNVSLQATGITAASYGTTTAVGTFVVDQFGRLSSAANTSIDFNYANVTNRPVANVILTGNVSGQANAVLTPDSTLLTITAQLVNNSVTLGTHTIGAYVANVISGNGIVVTGNDGSEGAIPNVTLQATGVTAASYGTTTAVGTFVVDQFGRLSSAANTSIDFNYANVTNRPVANIILTGNIVGQANAVLTSDSTLLIISANVSNDSITLGTHTIGAYVANVTGGNGIAVVNNTGGEANVANITLAPTGVNALTYGNATIIPVLTVDAWGRITSAANATMLMPSYTTFVANTTDGANITLSGSDLTSSNVSLTGNSFISLYRSSNSSILITTRSNITIGTTAPSSPAVNDIWIDTN